MYLCIWSGFVHSNVALTSACTQGYAIDIPLVNFIRLSTSNSLVYNVMKLYKPLTNSNVHCNAQTYIAQVDCMATAVTIASIICWHPFYYYTCVVMYHQSTHYVFYMLFVITTALLYVVICGSVTIGNYCTGDMCTYVQWNQPGELLVTSFLPELYQH